MRKHSNMTQATEKKKRTKPQKKKTLNGGRPPLAPKPKPTLSKKASQSLIRSHHNLNKELVQVEASGDDTGADKIKKRISDLGGLESYQLASIQGQATERGGDSSKVLVGWLQDIQPTLISMKPKLRMLEIGALSAQNACSRSGMFEIQLIDLNSQSKGITKQDFMERPVPELDDEKLDVISLSLVVNFVPTPEGRGKMIKRTCQFLHQRARCILSESLRSTFPALFLVLPVACITNSRYMDEERLTVMMASLGYVLLKRKETNKLLYYLWQLRDQPIPDEQNFEKKKVNAGGGRNNFSIVLKQ